MFMWGYIRFLLSAVVLWFIIIRITKDEQGVDWQDAAKWLAYSYLASIAAFGLAVLVGVPPMVAALPSLGIGVIVLAYVLKAQYGGDKTAHIIIAYLVVRLIFSLPRLLPHLKSLYSF